MRNIFNFLITLAVFWLGNTYFSEFIQIQDNKTLLLASIFMFVIGWLFQILLGISVLLIPVGVGCLTIIPLMIAALVLTPIKLMLLDKYLVGFGVSGFWTYVVLTVVFSIFSVSAESKKS